MLETRRFWEKTRETPDQTIGPAPEKWPSPISVNEDPGRSFSLLFPMTTLHDPERSVPRACMREIVIVTTRNRLVRPLRSNHLRS
jgi:hypothetical protein